MRLERTRVLVVAVLVSGLLLAGVGGVSAQSYYNQSDNDNLDQDRDSWLSGVDLTLAGLIMLVSRVGTWIIGTGIQSPSGAPAGALATGVMLGGLMLGMGASSRVGMVAGGTLGMSSIFAIAAIDFAPSWMYAVALFALGLLASAVIRRQLQ
jgi:hypothetical protein